MKAESILSFVGSGILGGGVVSSIVAFRKLKPESDQIIVSSAKDVILIQKGAMDNLREQLAEQREQMEAQGAQMAAMEARFESRLDRAEQARWTAETALAECHRAREALLEDYAQEKARNAELEERIAALEAEVAKLRAESTQRHPNQTGDTT